MSDYLDPNNEELLKDFFSEAQAQVDSLERNILVLESESNNREAVDEIFRAAHTLKGGAATVEMLELAGFTHLVEDLLDAIRADQLVIDETVVDSLLAAIDTIKAMLKERMSGSVYRADTSLLEKNLRQFLPEASAAKKPKSGKTAETVVKASQTKSKTTAKAAKLTTKPPASTAVADTSALSEYELLELRQASEAGSTVYKVSVRFNEDNLMNTVGGIQVYAALKEAGAILKTVPDFEKLYEDNFYEVVDYYVAASRSSQQLQKLVTIPDVTLGADIVPVIQGSTQEADQAEVVPSVEPSLSTNAASAATVKTTPKTVGQAENTRPGDDSELSSRAEDREAKEAEAKRAGREAGSILRVDSKRIDNLLNLVSETVITKATFNQISSQFAELLVQLQSTEAGYREKIKDLFDTLPEYLEAIRQGQAIKDIKKEITDRWGDLFTLFDSFGLALKANVGKFRSTAQNLGRITGELQEGVMRIRMVPISQIFSRFPRLVRDLSKSLNKKINLVIEGEETELDKSVIEDLLDPIMHSVRNSIDHGIESPEDRLAAGKPEIGRVLLKAGNEGNMIIIEIIDDGRGIDVESIRRKAVERALIHPNKLLTDIEAFNLIFEPGFSTSKAVSSISGRGVGLDVVKRHIEKLNGTVSVASEPGKGSKFTIKLPLTLAIIQGLLVRVGEEVYSIPITSVIESHRIKPTDIKMIDNYEVFNVRNDVISLLRLNRLFGIKTKEQQEYRFVVIVGTAEKKVGLMVDSLIGEEDVVIKPLRDQFTNSPGIAGASILGDGSVSLIIDVSQLLDLGLRKELEERRRREATIR